MLIPRSALYHCKVSHKRFSPKAHRFTYKTAMLLLDIDRLEKLSSESRLFSYNRLNLFSFFDRDHGPRDGTSIRSWAEDLLQKEGLCLGTSSGINVAGAIQMAKDLGPGHNIVTILCDYGTRYQSRLFNVEFLKSKGLPFPCWLE